MHGRKAGADLFNDAVQPVFVHSKLDQACFDSSQEARHMLYKAFLVLPETNEALSSSFVTAELMSSSQNAWVEKQTKDAYSI